MLMTDTKEASADFWNEFQTEKDSILNTLTDLNNTIPALKLKSEFNNILSRINNLEKSVIAASIYLPPHDKETCSKQIKQLNEELNKRKVLLTPKSKFSFKSRNKIKKNTEVINNLANSSTELNKETKEIINVPKNAFLLSNKTNSYLIPPQDLHNTTKDVYLNDLESCIVDLVNIKFDIAILQMNRINNCVVFVNPIKSSMIIDNCNNCYFVLACHQFRMHDSKNIDVYLHCSSHPIIEDCSNIRFTNYELPINNIEELFNTSDIDINNNQYNLVEDFKWLKQQKSPNWDVMEKSERKPIIFLEDKTNIDLWKKTYLPK
ncbi:TBCC-domain-containing protein [Anaeromyces robustus]|uniref:TBCC-domain-containing protein n=1 Tax=Anaeromyces robustus TaxID=1754192 RepID=A0A1Y1X9G9_9FUNG|nr:TBCC-domain-containing protein [Anaeromyces robustus]|eukprot:ORX82378.1 TBCC-domain-containing protein [Anaeromyces robustus]